MTRSPRSAHGVVAYTQVDPVPSGRSLGEARLVQPVLMGYAGAFSNRVRLLTTSVGVRVSLGMPMHRMGRYGVVQDTAGSPDMRQHEHHHD